MADKYISGYSQQMQCYAVWITNGIAGKVVSNRKDSRESAKFLADYYNKLYEAGKAIRHEVDW